MRLSKKFICLAFTLAFFALGDLNVHAEGSQRAKGIILLIGDGMGLNVIRAAEIYSQKAFGKPLTLNALPVSGVTTTHAADSEVTDSASAATALYSGHKNNNGVINILPDGKKADTIAHAAKESGMAVGIVSTTRLTHATPAALYSHSHKRDDEQYIADQLLGFSPDVALAGGLQYFVSRNVLEKSKRKDDKDWVKDFKASGYTYVATADDLKSLMPADVKKLLGLFSASHMSYELDRQHVAKFHSQPSFAEMTKAALSVVEKNPRGFFVMAEAGRIDHACHARDLKAAIYDTMAFDEAVKVALDFQKTHPDVLVLVTADHETGGLGLGRGTEYAVDLMTLKPITASLEYINTKFRKGSIELDELLKASGIDLTDSERRLLLKNPPQTKSSALSELSGLAEIDDYVFSWLHYCLGVIESERAKVGWTSFAHTAQPVVTYAKGPGENEFSGTYDNTDIAKKMAHLLGLTLRKPYN